MRLLAAVLGLAVAFPALAADAPKRVCVLYFDNNTPKRDYDVLQKGLADMLVTDLSAVESLQVVEREKLQSIIDELKLQRSKYFDPKTAQQLGKVAGAELAVTGAFAELEPSMRIDIRLIEVATGKVLLAEKVTGEAKNFFDLQQELVDVFVKGLNVKLKASARGKSGATELDSLLKYSKGVDAADKGDLATASATLAEVVKDNPEFKLAKERYAELLKKLEASSQKRKSVFNAIEEALLKQADEKTAPGIKAIIGNGPPPSGKKEVQQWLYERRDALNEHLGWRALKANITLNKVKEKFTPAGNTPYGVTLMSPEQQVEVMKLFGQYVPAEEQLLKDLRELIAIDPILVSQSYGGQLKAHEKELKDLNLAWGSYTLHDSDAQVEAAFAKLLATGVAEGATYMKFMPAPAKLDPSLGKLALKHLEAAEKRVPLVGAGRDGSDGDEKVKAAAYEVYDAWAESLLALGRKEDAVSKWQKFLDAYPTHPRFKDVEARVKDVLCASDDCKAFEEALAKCTSGPMMMKGAQVLPRIARADGSEGLRRVYATATKTCPAKDPNYPQLDYNIAYLSLLTQVGMQAMTIGDCKLYQEVKKVLVSKAASMAMSFDNWSACN
ncbi:MAG: hypothetical protein K1X89_28385 [Myxococcaceae bacterium]|nr:hypothetical protein [Myxococcaceae bacterium]